jgi:hypothetical protein
MNLLMMFRHPDHPAVSKSVTPFTFFRGQGLMSEDQTR